MKTIFNSEITAENIQNAKEDYRYQKELTSELDDLKGDFNQEIINEIVLWKVNRYSLLDDETFSLINQIKKEDKELNVEFTKKILTKLLNTKGIQLAMASTILRFKNPNIYQIIDQRVYRFIRGVEFPKYFSSIEKQIECYIEYLQELRQICSEKEIEFNQSDRVLYELDKKINEKISLKNYGSRTSISEK